ncbi:MAG: hypothetical protein M3Y33_02950 [Actinomycetota bacterium]|nr:hypothetical protein [Actinomycetota bacterium]
MRLEWVFLAEGIGVNASGAVTAISINANVFPTAAVPAVTKRVVLAHFTAESEESAGLIGKEITITLRVTGPSGEAIFAHGANARLATPAWPALPSGFDVALEAQLRVTEFGKHEVELSAHTEGGPALKAQSYLYVVEPPKAAV